MQCQVNEYNDECEGRLEAIDVIYTKRDMDENYNDIWQAGETVKVCMCDYHRKWLEKLHYPRPLEMRGARVEYALREDLFRPFNDKETLYSLVELTYYASMPENEPYMLLTGKDMGTIELMMSFKQTNPNILQMCAVGIFQHVYKVFDQGNLDTEQSVEYIVELKNITKKTAINALAEKIQIVYTPFQSKDEQDKWTKIKKNFTPDELNAISKKKYNTEYTVKPMPPLIRDYFKKKGAEYNQYRL